eukprot:scaffold263471_cov39-Attheya_sp.AAC.1
MVSLPSGQPRGTSTSTAGAAASAVDESIQLLPRPHVPPLSAPNQMAAVPNNAAAQKGGTCAFWPICDMDYTECGGRSKEGCKIYGTGGTKRMSSTKKLKRSVRNATWSNAGKERACYWVPYCMDKSCVCGGSRKQWCSKFGENGSHTHDTPSEDNQIAAKATWINKRDAENLRQGKSCKT